MPFLISSTRHNPKSFEHLRREPPLHEIYLIPTFPMATSLPTLPAEYQEAVRLIDAAHAQDPRPADKGRCAEDTPYELYYAQELTRWLALRSPDATPVLQVACRAQHFKRYDHH